MSGDVIVPCPRCGVARQVKTGGAGKHCQDCKTLRGAARVSRNWMDDAACATTDPDAFFPEAGASTTQAKAVCASCPVRRQCLADAPTWDRFSIRGGLAAYERRKTAA
jgi:WhiB family redox-sensing transcriptional regulator